MLQTTDAMRKSWAGPCFCALLCALGAPFVAAGHPSSSAVRYVDATEVELRRAQEASVGATVNGFTELLHQYMWFRLATHHSA